MVGKEGYPEPQSEEETTAYLIEIGVIEDPKAVSVPLGSWTERPMSSGFTVNEVRTPEENAALDAAYRALEDQEAA